MKSKERFLKAMAALKSQHDNDVAYAKDVSAVLVVDMAPYNNSEVVNIVVDELASWFHDPEEAKNEINSFMYDQAFGKSNGRSQERNFLNLWNRLNMPWIKTVDVEEHPWLTQQELQESAALAKDIRKSATGMHNSDPFGNFHDYKTTK